MATRKKYNFRGGYQAPTSSAFGGALGAPTPVASTAVAPADPPAGIPDPYGIVPTATNSANATYGRTLAGIVGNENLLASQYGLTPNGFTDEGLIKGFNPIGENVDPNNPFSRASLLNKAFHQQQNRSLTGYAAAGQHSSGAYGRQVLADQSGYDQSKNDLINSALSALGGYNQQAGAAYSTQQQAILDAQLQALQAALAQKG